MPKKITKIFVILAIVGSVVLRIYLIKDEPVNQETVTASTQWIADTSGEKAFDGDEITHWQSAGTTSAGEWLEVRYSEPRLVNYLAFNGYGAYTPKSFRLLASLDGKAWQALYEGENKGESGSWQTFKFKNNNYFDYYKLEIISGRDALIVGISEMKLGDDIGQFKLGLFKLKKALISLKNIFKK